MSGDDSGTCFPQVQPLGKTVQGMAVEPRGLGIFAFSSYDRMPQAASLIRKINLSQFCRLEIQCESIGVWGGPSCCAVTWWRASHGEGERAQHETLWRELAFVTEPLLR